MSNSDGTNAGAGAGGGAPQRGSSAAAAAVAAAHVAAVSAAAGPLHMLAALSANAAPTATTTTTTTTTTTRTTPALLQQQLLMQQQQQQVQGAGLIAGGANSACPNALEPTAVAALQQQQQQQQQQETLAQQQQQLAQLLQQQQHQLILQSTTATTLLPTAASASASSSSPPATAATTTTSTTTSAAAAGPPQPSFQLSATTLARLDEVIFTKEQLKVAVEEFDALLESERQRSGSCFQQLSPEHKVDLQHHLDILVQSERELGLLGQTIDRIQNLRRDGFGGTQHLDEGRIMEELGGLLQRLHNEFDKRAAICSTVSNGLATISPNQTITAADATANATTTTVQELKMQFERLGAKLFQRGRMTSSSNSAATVPKTTSDVPELHAVATTLVAGGGGGFGDASGVGGTLASWNPYNAAAQDSSEISNFGSMEGPPGAETQAVTPAVDMSSSETETAAAELASSLGLVHHPDPPRPPPSIKTGPRRSVIPPATTPLVNVATAPMDSVSPTQPPVRTTTTTTTTTTTIQTTTPGRARTVPAKAAPTVAPTTGQGVAVRGTVAPRKRRVSSGAAASERAGKRLPLESSTPPLATAAAATSNPSVATTTAETTTTDKNVAKETTPDVVVLEVDDDDGEEGNLKKQEALPPPQVKASTGAKTGVVANPMEVAEETDEPPAKKKKKRGSEAIPVEGCGIGTSGTPTTTPTAEKKETTPAPPPRTNPRKGGKSLWRMTEPPFERKPEAAKRNKAAATTATAAASSTATTAAAATATTTATTTTTTATTTPLLDANHGKDPQDNSDKPIQPQPQVPATTTAGDDATTVTVIVDRHADRIVNPLLELPQYPRSIGRTSQGMLSPMGGNLLRPDAIPNGAELWNVAQVYFAEPDTYPVAYLARLLGFEVPPEAPSSETVTLDPATVPLVSQDKDPFLQIPPLGNFMSNIQARRLRARARRGGSCGNRRLSSSSAASKLGKRKRLNDQGQEKEAEEDDNDLRRSEGDDHHVDDIDEDGKDTQEDEEEELDFPDPMWKSVLGQYRGYDAETFKTVAAYCLPTSPAAISATCVAQAVEFGIVHPNVSFRYATSTDVDAIVQLAEAQGKEKTRDALNRVLACPSQFVIVAERKEEEGSSKLLGFAEYQLCWYRILDVSDSTTTLEDATGGGRDSGGKPKEAKSSVAELVLFLRSLVEDTSDENKTDKEKDDIPMVLTALVLEHARSCDIWYAMFDAPKEQVELFATFFRMTRLPPLKADATCVPLLCDVKKCSSRYAFVRKRESRSALRHSKPQTPPDHVEMRERVLLRLCAPLATEGEATPVAASKSEHKTRSTTQRKLRKVGEIFSNAREHQRDKFVGVRVAFAEGGGSADKILSITTALQSGNLSDCKPVQANAMEHGGDWEVLRFFPLLDAPKPRAKEDGVTDNDGKEQVSEPTDADSDDFILQELKEKQSRLRALESSLEPKLRFLLQSVYDERVEFESETAKAKRAVWEDAHKRFDAILERRREADLAWQMQMEQDMDAVCDVCADGEVTPDNQILFCESCNVAVHQKCYGIPAVPEGDYFCHPCRFFGRDKQMSSKAGRSIGGFQPPQFARDPLPICCELCPRRQGAFIKVHTTKKKRKHGAPSLQKWVHVVCAKWHGLQFVEEGRFDEVEDPQEMKDFFLGIKMKCDICEGMRGAYHKCAVVDCKRTMHVTCARAVGICKMIHGECHSGPVETQGAWTVMCPEHSKIEENDIAEGSLTVEQLKKASEAFPPEPKPRPKPKEFDKMNGKERADFFSDREYEEEFMCTIMERLEGARCAICNVREEADEMGPDGKRLNGLRRCENCSVVLHTECLMKTEQACTESETFVCASCQYIQENKDKDDYSVPQCHMCNQPGGALSKAFANPVSKKVFRNKTDAYKKKSLFGRSLWCHTVCGMWHPACRFNEDGQYDCSDVIMANGLGHILPNKACMLCGRSDKVKSGCSVCGTNKKSGGFRFHYSCARQAGLDVIDDTDDGREGDTGAFNFILHCYKHTKCENVLRAKIEDMLELEKQRSGPELRKMDGPMIIADAARLHQWGVTILQCLGWAWRWAAWWVSRGDNWEPLLEPGEDEAKMTKEQLRIVDSTRESRMEDAKKCRLAAFGAALRHREYDKEEGDDVVALANALRAVLSTRSLVGPLKPKEVEFLVEWLARSYRSKSPMLGFGEDRIPVAEEGPYMCFADGTFKEKLGNRPLPGKQELAKGEVFETGIEEPNDFLEAATPLEDDGGKSKSEKKATTRKRRKKVKGDEAEKGDLETTG